MVVGLGGFAVNTMSLLNPSCIKLELGLGFDSLGSLKIYVFNNFFSFQLIHRYRDINVNIFNCPF